MKSTCPDTLKTDALQQQVEGIRAACEERLDSHAPHSVNALDSWLLAICTVSPYIARTLAQYPDLLPTLIQRESIGQAIRTEANLPTCVCMVRDIEDAYSLALADAPDPDAKAREAIQQRVLRLCRHQHMVRILWCDLTESYSLEHTLEQLSSLAQACVVVAEQWTYDALVGKFGVPVDSKGREQRLIVIGMGKLGGGELNVSSDIDIICVYPSGGNTRHDTGELSELRPTRNKTLDNGDFFRRSVQGLCKLLHSITEDGFVYRVDTRLRPFGESGPPVVNLDGLESYYLTQAREWERYAMIKGRALCGHPEDIEELERLIAPFVYRRYLDYNAFESLRDLKRKIALSLLKNSMRDNIKLGAGGIREIEFIGQAFQLVRGGQDSRLRIRPIMQVLPLLGKLELLKKSEVTALMAAYKYLRRVENAVQTMRDEQVHALPEDTDDRLRLLCMLDESSWDAFRQTLDTHQSAVSVCFNQLFAIEESGVQSSDSEHALKFEQASDLWIAVGSETIGDDQRCDLLHAAGFNVDDSLLASIATLTQGSFYQRLAAQSQQRVEHLVSLVLMFATECDHPGVTLGRMLRLIKAVAGRSGYLQVLIDQPKALQHLLCLFSNSSWLAGFVASQPMVIDELLTNASLQPDADSVLKETTEYVERLKESDLELQMDSLRHYQQARQMRIACAQLDGSLSVMQVSDQLSWLAESVICGVLTLVSAPLNERFGIPCHGAGNDRQQSHLGVIAYGKLGGLELGYGSDLDLVFIHDSTGAEQLTEGPKSIDNTLYYAKLAQKFVHFMGTRTPAGILYEIDLRLRPNGSSGVLVTGIETFADYQSSDAWTWEHQALIRARLVYGHQDLLNRFASVRQHALAKKRVSDELKLAVANMRERMRLANGNTDAELMDLKQDSGGVADIEFIVQYLVLAYSSEHVELLRFTDNIRILECAEKLQLLPAQDAQALQDAYLMLRQHLHRRALDDKTTLVPKDDALEDLAKNVITLRQGIIGLPEAKTQ